jgi:alpha-N-arabinofuranosidase
MTRTYRNPILGGFYPDPSICRVDSDFYLVNSTFAYFPGIPVFHSRDLLNWKQIGNAIDRPGQICFDGHHVSLGLFAPTIRHHQGIFYILCTLVSTGGNFIITAQDPAGPWSDPFWLSGAPGIDPSIMFDNDGRVWFTGTRGAPEGEAFPGDCEIYVQEMNLSLLADGKNPLIGEQTGIWRGALHNSVWAEGPHIYKIRDWYYLLYAEGGTGRDHAVCVARAKKICGPWEGKKSNPLLTHRYLGKNAEIVNTGHADIVDDPEGNWWMVLLASRPFNKVCPLGRETFMVPISWEDGWPWIASKTGLIEWEYPLPRFPNSSATIEWSPECACDQFDTKLPLHWLMLRMPMQEKDIALSLTDRPGALRLFTRAATMRGKDHPAFAGRRLRHKNWAFSAAIQFTPKTAGEAAGIILFQNEDWQYRFEICLDNSGRPSLHFAQTTGGLEFVTVRECPEIDLKSPEAQVVLAARCDEMELTFFYGKEPHSLKHFTGEVDARPLSTEYAGGFVGTLAGVFASGNGKSTENYADVLWAEYKSL